MKREPSMYIDVRYIRVFRISSERTESNVECSIPYERSNVQRGCPQHYEVVAENSTASPDDA